MATTNNLKAYSDRASEAEDRLERLETLMVKKEDENLELKKVVKELQSKLEAVQEKDRLERLEALLVKKEDENLELKKLVKELESKLEAVQEKAGKEAEKLQVENAKLKYRIVHLIRALEEADVKRS
ncbi:myosin-9 [Impatiens glandulifera]|uniref:myosin-9 n=1 Tax=Impatiens glandulifera TaxID=253017 RepID=UPI001FB14CD8|nr:myosin-9 [Impatiens glandulifera]